MRRKAETVLQDLPGLECAGVYALVDDTGRMYIGSAVNLRKRLEAHNRGLWVASRGEHDAFESQRLQDAVMAGRVFRVSILAAFPSGVSAPYLRQVERDLIAEYSELGPLYNDRVRGKGSAPLLKYGLEKKARSGRR